MKKYNIEDLNFCKKSDRKEFFELINNDTLIEVNNCGNLTIYVFNLDVYYEAFIFNEKKELINRQIANL